MFTEQKGTVWGTYLPVQTKSLFGSEMEGFCFATTTSIETLRLEVQKIQVVV